MTQAWYPFFWSDYSGKTMHLTQGQHGAFLLFMRFIYTTEKPIPHKQRYSIARATLEQEQCNADEVLDEFFVRDGDFWHNTKCDDIILKANEKHQRRVNAGKTGGLKKSSNARAKPKQSESDPHPESQSDRIPLTPKIPRVGSKAGFSGFGILDLLDDDGLQDARAHAPGWDLHSLGKMFDDSIANGRLEAPRHPNKAFPKWVHKITKGKRPA